MPNVEDYQAEIDRLEKYKSLLQKHASEICSRQLELKNKIEETAEDEHWNLLVDIVQQHNKDVWHIVDPGAGARFRVGIHSAINYERRHQLPALQRANTKYDVVVWTQPQNDARPNRWLLNSSENPGQITIWGTQESIRKLVTLADLRYFHTDAMTKELEKSVERTRALREKRERLTKTVIGNDNDPASPSFPTDYDEVLGDFWEQVIAEQGPTGLQFDSKE